MSQFTPAQTATLKAYIQADPDLSVKASAGDYDGVATGLNAAAAGPFYVWQDLPMATVQGLIDYAKMTPADSVPTDTALNVAVWQARSLACQGKQFNLQNLTIGRNTAPMTRTGYRAAMQDCLTNLPAGASGSLLAANWVGVRDAAKATATVAEKVLATGTGSINSPADAGWRGLVDVFEIGEILS